MRITNDNGFWVLELPNGAKIASKNKVVVESEMAERKKRCKCHANLVCGLCSGDISIYQDSAWKMTNNDMYGHFQAEREEKRRKLTAYKPRHNLIRD